MECRLNNASLTISPRNVLEGKASINLTDLAEFNGKASADFTLDEDEVCIFGYLQRVNTFRQKIKYSRGPGDFLKKSRDFKNAVDKDDPEEIFYNRRMCESSIGDDEGEEETLSATMRDFPSMPNIPLECQGAPLVWADVLIEFTTWVGYQILTAEKRTRKKKHKSLNLLCCWESKIMYSYLKSRVSPHVNTITSDRKSVHKDGNPLMEMFSGVPANWVITNVEENIVKAGAWS